MHPTQRGGGLTRKSLRTTALDLSMRKKCFYGKPKCFFYVSSGYEESIWIILKVLIWLTKLYSKATRGGLCNCLVTGSPPQHLGTETVILWLFTCSPVCVCLYTICLYLHFCPGGLTVMVCGQCSPGSLPCVCLCVRAIHLPRYSCCSLIGW